MPDFVKFNLVLTSVLSPFNLRKLQEWNGIWLRGQAELGVIYTVMKINSKFTNNITKM